MPACSTAGRNPPVDRVQYVADLVPAAVVAPCDTSERPVQTTDDVVTELTRTRDQRDACAAKVDRAREHRAAAEARVARLNSAEDKPSSGVEP